MDLICTNCGEPWDVDHVLHESPEDFKRKGGVITYCPSCQYNKPEEMSEQQKLKLDAIEMIGDMLGDDIDGLAAEIEDMGLI